MLLGVSMIGHGEYPFDVIVAGVGSVGSAACYHLAKRGVSVLGLEQFGIPHTHGSHHGHSRMIRQAYFEHPDYVPLLRRAYELWEELDAVHGGAILHLPGGLYIGPEDGTIVSGSRRAAVEHGLEHTMLGSDEIAERYPAIRPPSDHVAFFERRGGFVVPERAVAAHATAARRAGAELHTGERLVSWEANADHVSVATEQSRFTAEKLVITSGAWSAEVIRDLGIELQVTRQVLAWFEPIGEIDRFAPGQFPCWFIETESPFGHYGFPILPGDPGLKVALHKPGELIDPSEAPEPPCADETDALREVLDEFFPGCAGELAHACTCKYTNSPDGHFIIGQHPGQERVAFACGLSGHGFKFSTVLGEALADIALDGEDATPGGLPQPDAPREPHLAKAIREDARAAVVVVLASCRDRALLLGRVVVRPLRPLVCSQDGRAERPHYNSWHAAANLARLVNRMD